MKKSLLLGILSLVFLSVPSHAAPVFNWTGCYVGGNVGGAWGMVGVEADIMAHSSGALGGLQTGCNWQNGVWVGGVTTGFDWSHIHGSREQGGDLYSATSTYYGTVEMQGGYLIVPNVKLYGTGGFAYGNNIVKVTSGSDTFQDSHIQTGWTLGAGIEWSPTYNLSTVRWSLQYNYVDLGTKNFHFGGETEPIISHFNAITLRANFPLGLGTTQSIDQAATQLYQGYSAAASTSGSNLGGPYVQAGIGGGWSEPNSPEIPHGSGSGMAADASFGWRVRGLDGHSWGFIGAGATYFGNNERFPAPFDDLTVKPGVVYYQSAGIGPNIMGFSPYAEIGVAEANIKVSAAVGSATHWSSAPLLGAGVDYRLDSQWLVHTGFRTAFFNEKSYRLGTGGATFAVSDQVTSATVGLIYQPRW